MRRSTSPSDVIIADALRRPPRRGTCVATHHQLEPGQKADTLPGFAGTSSDPHDRSRGVEWACESIPEETWRARRLAAFEVHFIAECRHGSRIRARTAGAGDGAFVHAVVREEDGRELARLRTRWVEREPASGTGSG